MKKSIIHMTPEEQLASNSESTLSAVQQGAKQVVSAIQSIPPLDMSETNQILSQIRDEEKPAVTQVELKGISVITLKGDKGDAGKTPTQSEVIKLLKPFIPKPLKGENGKNYILSKLDKEEIASRITVPVVEKVIEKTLEKTEVVREIPIITHEIKEVAVTDTAVQIVEKINDSNTTIDAERVRGLVNVIRYIEKDGTNPQGDNGGWTGGKTVRYLQNGTEVSAFVTEINYGSGITATYANNGRITLTATGGAGFTELPATGTVDGVVTSFTFTQVPSYIVVDGIWLKPLANDGVTVNWSNVLLTITMTNPPAQSIWGVA